jgi:hypothetical protein
MCGDICEALIRCPFSVGLGSPGAACQLPRDALRLADLRRLGPCRSAYKQSAAEIIKYLNQLGWRRTVHYTGRWAYQVSAAIGHFSLMILSISLKFRSKAS